MTSATPTNLLTTAFATLVMLLAAPALAEEPRIDELSVLDRQYMMQQRELINGVARRYLGRGFSGERDDDLALLQELLDKDLVRGDQRQELQAMGVIMGDHLAAELDMHWVVFEDKIGRSRALRYGETDSFLFPMTMISRRREVGNTDSVEAVYSKSVNIIEHSRAALRFN